MSGTMVHALAMGEDNPNDPQFMFKRQVDYCSGAFLLFRKTDFLNLNGFDNRFSRSIILMKKLIFAFSYQQIRKKIHCI